jgi:endoglucanase
MCCKTSEEKGRIKQMMIQAISLAMLLGLSTVAYAQDKDLWEQYKINFISEDGRITDYNQSLISHSEGQGYGMRLSVLYDDKTTFEKIWQWTKNNLKVRADNLFAWEWGKRPNGEWRVIDYNNATDGDILIAYSLLKASEKWHDIGYRSEAIRVIQDIRKNLCITWHGRIFLLPSYYGFNKENGFVVNPSYLILNAFRSFAKEDQKSFWENIYTDGLFLIEQSCFGKLCLPSDWVILTKDQVSIYMGNNPYFGSDAIRVLLHLSAEKTVRYPKGIGKIFDIYKQMGYLPLWTDLEKDSFSLYPAPAGYYAIYALVAKRLGDTVLSAKLLNEARKKLIDDKNKGYYSFSLYLLATSDQSEYAY